MAEYIEREKALDVINLADFIADEHGLLLYADSVQACLLDIPSADVIPVVHGHWEWAEGVHVYGVDSKNQHGSVRCSACGNCSPHSTNYCGICGARMDEDG